MVGSIHDIAATRGILDHDLFKDEHGNIYFVLGHYQPRDRIISLLKYVPDEQGTWIHRETSQRYARSYWHQGIEAMAGSEAVVKKLASTAVPSWEIVDPVFGTMFLEVPHESVKEYMLPEARLEGILETSDTKLDEVERKVKLVAQTILKHAGNLDLTTEDVGITGSILWRGYSERSDINLNVYGEKKCRGLEKALVSLAKRQVMLARGLTIQMKGFEDVHGVQLSGTVKTSELKRKPKLKLDGFKPGIQIRWCLKRDEFPIVYGSETYVDRGIATIKARVTDDHFTLFYPALVGIETLEGKGKPDRVLIYDTRYTRLLRSGDVVEITGLLQEIKGSGRFQILIGSRQHAKDERVTFLDTHVGE
jgi:predicted nucleotidyltransferase